MKTLRDWLGLPEEKPTWLDWLLTPVVVLLLFLGGGAP